MSVVFGDESWGQAAMHAPQPVHLVGSQETRRPYGKSVDVSAAVIDSAPVGQTATQTPQWTQRARVSGL